MKRYLLILISLGLLFGFSSCETLDLDPESETSLTEKETLSTYDGYHGFFLKLYSSMTNPGQGGAGGWDVFFDAGRSVYLRALSWCQECPTDEVVYRTASGYGMRQTTSFDWDSGLEFPSYIYYRLYITISLCNDFLRKTEDDFLKSMGVYDEVKGEVGYWRAEARFIRAFQYYLLCDLFGSVGWVDDSSPNGTYPIQKTRSEIFDYVESELIDIDNQLMPANKVVHGRANQVAAWFLLSKLYISANVYRSTSHDNLPDAQVVEYSKKALTYAKKVIDDQNFSLAPNYIENFLKDNNTCKEIIWGLAGDAIYSFGQGGTESGTGYILAYPTDQHMLESVDFGTTMTWGLNGVLRSTIVDKFDEEDQDFHLNDTWGDTKKDKRALFFVGPESASLSKNADGTPVRAALRKETWMEGKDFGYFTGDKTLGASFTKWRNVTKDRVKGTPDKHSGISFPMFRKADAYLVAAEAILRGGGGSITEALGYVNEVRDRAYKYGNYAPASGDPAVNAISVNGRITEKELSLDFLIDERARELWTENWRRSDLIRFDKFCSGYNWDWKGRSTTGELNHEGRDINPMYKLFAIPEDDIRYNPNLTQNPDYIK